MTGDPSRTNIKDKLEIHSRRYLLVYVHSLYHSHMKHETFKPEPTPLCWPLNRLHVGMTTWCEVVTTCATTRSASYQYFHTSTSANNSPFLFCFMYREAENQFQELDTT